MQCVKSAILFFSATISLKLREREYFLEQSGRKFIFFTILHSFDTARTAYKGPTEGLIVMLVFGEEKKTTKSSNYTVVD